MAAASVLSGTVIAASGSNTPPASALPAKYSSVTVSVSSSYNATAATTGVKLSAAYSIDGGLTYSDYALVATTAPTPSQGSPQSSQQFAVLAVGSPGATHIQFKLVNQDATNAATVNLSVRAAV